MDKVRDDFDVITYETDSVLYYNPEDLYNSETKEKLRRARKEGIEKGREEGIKETAINFKKMGIPLDQISLATGLDINYLENL